MTRFCCFGRHISIRTMPCICFSTKHVDTKTGLQRVSSVKKDWCRRSTWPLTCKLTTPSGSTSSRCLGRLQCIPVSTYCPGLVALSRTRKSPSRFSRFSASRRLIRPWYQASLRSCSSVGATGALRRGGLGHWSSSTRTPPPASCRRRASSNGPDNNAELSKSENAMHEWPNIISVPNPGPGKPLLVAFLGQEVNLFLHHILILIKNFHSECRAVQDNMETNKNVGPVSRGISVVQDNMETFHWKENVLYS